MKHSYSIQGMTCDNCAAKIKGALLKLTDVTSAEINRNSNSVVIEMSKHIPTSELQSAIGLKGKYTISENASAKQMSKEMNGVARSWLQTYKPVLLIFFYITLTTSVVAYFYTIPLESSMYFFMALFFIVFSFFKLLDLKGFASNYTSYDIISKRVFAWGYIYPFIELTLGLAYLSQINLKVTNLVTIVVMGVSTIGVLQSVLNKRKIQCACLGTVFNLPMSTVTIIENGLMIAMSVAMLIMI